MLVTLWRIPSLIRISRMIREKRANREKGIYLWLQRTIMKLFISWIYDIPYVPFFIVTLPCFWRSYVLIRELLEVCDHPLLFFPLSSLARFIAGAWRFKGSKDHLGSRTFGACGHTVRSNCTIYRPDSVASSIAGIQTFGKQCSSSYLQRSSDLHLLNLLCTEDPLYSNDGRDVPLA